MMKLAKAKIQYPCGTTVIDRVSLDVQTGEVLISPRLRDVMKEMDKSETSSSFSVEYQGRMLTVAVDTTGTFRIKVPDVSGATRPSGFRSLAFPSKDQRQQNGRLLHLLSAASFVGAVFSALSTSNWNAHAFAQTGSLTISGLLLGAVGFYCIKED
jgi:hypothetical protein